MPVSEVYGQTANETYVGNAISMHWKRLSYRHIRIVFPRAFRSKAEEIAKKAENIYEEYKNRLGTALKTVTLYYLGSDRIISQARASKAFEPDIIWASSINQRSGLLLAKPSGVLRYEIATAFKHYIKSVIIKYWHFAHYPPDDIPWQDGLISYLAHPGRMPRQQHLLQNYLSSKKQNPILTRQQANRMNIRIGRSQIEYYKQLNNDWALPDIYTWHQSILGLFEYFNFKPAFKQAAGISYSDFEMLWRKTNYSTQKTDMLRHSKSTQSTKYPSRSVIDSSYSNNLPGADISPYRSLLHTQVKLPFIAPYYASPDNYGLGMYLRFEGPMGIHAIGISGLFSIAHPVHKSYIMFKYTNNSFRPRLTLRFNHFSSDALIIGRLRKKPSTSVLAVSSLWKIAGISRGKSNWYFGLRLRYMAFDYLPKKELRDKFPHLYYSNRKTHQTDLKAVLTWSHIPLNQNTFIYPGVGSGVRVSATGSSEILGSDVRYLRLKLGAYTILPAFKKQRIYLYINGVMDIGTPAGRDYLAFSKNGSYELASPGFLGSANPNFEQFVRGYNTLLTGSRFLFGRLEYRIPFEFNTTRKLLGFIPPARTVFTFFSDAGVMGDARVAPNRTETRYRWSAGFEIKRVFSFADAVRFAYELGIGLPLTKSFAPHPYFRIQMAVPF